MADKKPAAPAKVETPQEPAEKPVEVVRFKRKDGSEGTIRRTRRRKPRAEPETAAPAPAPAPAAAAPAAAPADQVLVVLAIAASGVAAFVLGREIVRLARRREG